ncbi:MAG: tetratricopeptide repeat protein, partial [Bacteroidetes bacterium]|nr:tetratricopeptide repeat protein [Bacteroidota bacterium]
FSFSFFISPAQDYQKTSPELSRRVDSLKKVIATLPALNGTDADTTRMKLSISIGQLYQKTNLDSVFWWYKSVADTLFKVKKIIKNPDKATQNSNVLNIIAQFAYDQSNYQVASFYWEQCLKIREILGDKRGASRCLGNLGNVYSAQGDFPKAKDFYEKCLRIAKKLEDDSIISNCFICLAYIFSGQGDYTKAIEYCEKSLKTAKEWGDRKQISDCLRRLGFMYRDQGNQIKAIENFEKCLKILEELGDRQGVSDCLSNLEYIFYHQGDYSKATGYYEKNMKIKEEVGDRQGISNCLMELGTINNNLSDYPKAMENYEKCLKIREELGDQHGISDCLAGLGNAYSDCGHYPKATEYYEKSLKIAEELRDQQGISYNLNNLGNVYSDQGDYPKAIEYYEKCLIMAEESDDQQGISYSLQNLGILYSDQGNHPKAMEYYEKSLKIAEKLSDKKGISSCMMNLGSEYSALGDYLKASLYLEKSLKEFEELGDRKGVSYCLNNLGFLWISQGDLQKALNYFKRSLKIAEELDAVADLASDYPTLARVYAIVNTPEKAKPLYLKSLELTVSLVRENFSILSEKEKGDYLEKTNSIFNNIAEFSLLFPQFDSLRGYCYNNELLLKGLLLNSARSMMEIVNNSADTALKNTYWLLSQQRKQISEQLSTPKDERTLNVDSLENAANNTERKLVKLSDVFADAQEQFGYIWQDVQKTLQPREAAIEFVKIKHTILRSDTLKTDSCSYAALVLKSGDAFPQFIALCNEESLEKLLTRGDENDFDLVERIYNSKTENTLYGLIWKPMESALAGCKKVFFAPAGQLHQISFAAIPTPSGKLLSDEYTLIQLSSTRELIRNSGKPAPSLKQAVVYGGINYETDSTLIAELAVIHNMGKAEVSEAISNAGGQDEESAWQYLPGTATEAENVCKLLTGNDMDQK